MKTKLVIIPSLIFAISVHAGSATWNLNPINEDWNTASNWTPATVPNGPADVATFGSSNDPNLFVFTATEVNEFVFNPDASAFTITATQSTEPLTISGSGVTNNSGTIQNFATIHEIMNQGGGEIVLKNAAKAGISTIYTIGKDAHFNIGSALTDMYFLDDSSADHARLTVISSQLKFADRSTADHASIACTQGIYPAGELWFQDESTAANARIIFDGASGADSTAGHGNFIGTATAGNATLIVNGSSGGGQGGSLGFSGDTTAAGSRITVNGGSDAGGTIFFQERATGGTASIALYDNGSLQIQHHDVSPPVTVGSLEGNGQVFLRSYTLAVGSNDLNRTFSGSIQDGGGRGGGKGVLKKVGRGTLTLDGANTYTGGTIATRGGLLVTNLNGSATGSGPVLVSGGSLGGNGIIAGAVTIGRGNRAAFLSPGIGPNLGNLTIQAALIFNPLGEYEVELDSDSLTTDQVVANGVTISSGATITITDLGDGVLSGDTTLTIINNTAIAPTVGNFDNLLDGSITTIGNNAFEVDYEGGDGNDLTLTVVP